ncbi:hypothetical protein BD309DRAFT_67928 [Dichomitus squalens]|nr:hypothetical protein BD309DRAFT_67928 [Dichomitus squalens]
MYILCQRRVPNQMGTSVAFFCAVIMVLYYSQVLVSTYKIILCASDGPHCAAHPLRGGLTHNLGDAFGRNPGYETCADVRYIVTNYRSRR